VEDAVDDSCVEEMDHVASSPVLCQMEHHIVYSRSYSVPLLFFNICKPGGELVALNELWACVTSQNDIGQDLWTVITQQEHPLLRRPFFHLHPCHTSELLKQINPHPVGQCNGMSTRIKLEKESNGYQIDLPLQPESIDTALAKQESCETTRHDVSKVDGSDPDMLPRAYLVAWLSSVAPLVMLQLSHKYANYT